MQKDCNYISLSSLKDRGWTESIIKKIGITHDKEAVNPRYRCASPMKLYDIKKIEAIESTSEFIQLYDAAKKRKVAGRRATETKIKAMKDYVHSIEIQMPKMNKEQIFRKAVAHYNDLWGLRGCYDKHISDYKTLDMSTLERLTANMIRHTMTDYECTLAQSYGKVGIEYAHEYLKDKINQMVHDAYFNDVA